VIRKERDAGVARGLRALIAVVCALLFVVAGSRAAHAGSDGIFDASIFSTTDGQKIYEQICQGCHMPDGRGATGAGQYPALAMDRTLAVGQYVALTVLKGRRNMPAFGAKYSFTLMGAPAVLSNAQMAAVINYVRSHFGNHYRDAVSADEIAALDAPDRTPPPK
jgi:mono/diheme cytochrome c family protein